MLGELNNGYGIRITDVYPMSWYNGHTYWIDIKHCKVSVNTVKSFPYLCALQYECPICRYNKQHSMPYLVLQVIHSLMGGGWFPKLVWPKHNMVNQQVKVGVAYNDKRVKCWCGTGKVGVATATPAIRHSPPMHSLFTQKGVFNFANLSSNGQHTAQGLGRLADTVIRLDIPTWLEGRSSTFQFCIMHVFFMNHGWSCSNQFT